MTEFSRAASWESYPKRQDAAGRRFAARRARRRSRSAVQDQERDPLASRYSLSPLVAGSRGCPWSRNSRLAVSTCRLFTFGLNITALWEADHIVPVVEGGGACGLDNYRTLCTPCHKSETAALAARLAEARSPQGRLPLAPASPSPMEEQGR